VDIQEEEITTLRCESRPAAETATVFQQLIQTSITTAQKNGRTSKTTGIPECLLCHPSTLPKALLLSPSQFSRHFAQHCVHCAERHEQTPSSTVSELC